MPSYSKDSGAKPASKAPQQGARSEGHRGFRGAQAAAPKKRWTQDDRATRGDRQGRPVQSDRAQRATRTGDRPVTGSKTSARDARRPDWTPREKSTYADRAARTERATERPAERPAYGDRSSRTERPAYGDRVRSERPTYSERPTGGDRQGRSTGGDRQGRPVQSDRADRTVRSDRADRTVRTERPSYQDRASRRDSAERAPRREHEDRAPRRDSAFYPSREEKTPFTHIDDVVLERLEASVITAGEVEGVTFADLGIGANIVRQLSSMGAEQPFAIQAATIPDVLVGKDVLGRGKTGSGKTIAFAAPLVERLMENNGGKDRKVGRQPRALILAPTRELAMQIDRTVQPIARSVGLFTTTIVGGVPQYKQVSALQRGVDIVIATPGRVEDLIEQGRLDLSNVFVTVIDEADHMCDLGFLEPVQRILRETRDGGQKLLFSATLDKGVAALVNEFLVSPAVHEVAGEDQASSDIDHRVLLIEQRDKTAIIEQLASGTGKTLIFTRTRAYAEQLSDQLEDAGIPATSLHGDLNQSRRTRNLSLLTSGRVNVLVATDVAARGIHVDDISLVIQADAPEEYKTYLHRSGRTGRAGKVGTVVTLISKSRRRRMDELLGRADIRASMVIAAPGDDVLQELAAL
jgi:superfamily II DNA/RNA helicase